jgi:hypothetical protein
LRGLFIFAILLAAGSVGDRVPQQTKLDLHRVGGLGGENGMVALQGDTISMFTAGDIRLEDGTGSGWTTPQKTSDGVTLKIKGSGWERVGKNLDRSIAYRPGLCDPFDQIDLPPMHGRLRSVLPKGAKVKLVQESQDYSFVVFSTSTGMGFYEVRVALLRPTGDGGYQLISTDAATESGIFCGMQGVDHDHSVVFTDEPSGSSDYLGAYVYQVTPKSRE